MGGETLEKRFLETARRLWQPGSTLVVGVSGGADSMALIFLLAQVNAEWPVTILPVHVDHGLRPESAGDAAWVVRVLDERLNMGVEVKTLRIARRRGESWEMAARRERYSALREYCRHSASDALIAVAHHQRDQAETVLMRIIAGTGIQGIQGMRERAGDVVRPLLSYTPGELREYLETKGVPWREDPTNRDPYWLRNRIRWELLPLLRQRFNPRVEEALASLAVRAGEEYAVIRRQSAQFVEDWAVSLDADVVRMPKEFSTLLPAVQADILQQIAQAHGLRVDRRHIRQARLGYASWPGGVQVSRDAAGGWLVGQPERDAAKTWTAKEMLPRSGEVLLGSQDRLVVTPGLFYGPEPGTSHICLENGQALAVRPWRVGDRMEPAGMAGHHKKLQDIFVDKKISGARRRQWPVIVDQNDNSRVLAVVGLAVAESVRCEIQAPCVRIQYFTRDFPASEGI